MPAKFTQRSGLVPRFVKIKEEEGRTRVDLEMITLYCSFFLLFSISYSMPCHEGGITYVAADDGCA